MSLTSWLQNLQSFCLLGPTTRKSRRAARCGSAKRFRPQLEALEDRCLPSFSPIASLSVGTTPQAVVTADFNSDGHLDLATASGGSNTVSVLLGNGLGGFGAASNFATGTGPRAMAVGDFDNDGNLDLATVNDPFANWSDYLAQLSVLRGNGDGTFQAPVNSDIWATPLSVAAADFNGDGNSDLVYSQSSLEYAAVDLRFGNGQGGFANADFDELWDTWSPVSLAIADLNNDGMLDVATANKDAHNVSVLLGNEFGTLDYGWSSADNFDAGQFPHAVAVGDFTDDGILDIVTAGQTVDVLPGLGDGTFAAPIHNSANSFGMTTVAAADFNGDGKLDVVTADPSAGTVSVLLGGGDGTLTPFVDYATGSSPRKVVIGDFNEDGRPDVAIGNGGIYPPFSSTPGPGSNTVSVLLNDGDWPDLNSTWLRIDDATVVERNTGTVAAFTVARFGDTAQEVTVGYATANESATAGSDYQAASGTLTFAPGEISKTITLQVNGDRLGEANETFLVTLSDPTNATIADSSGQGTIIDDEPRVSISDLSKSEGKNGQTTLFNFTVTLSASYDVPVTLNFATSNGTAKTSDNDYVANSGIITFAPNQTSKTITVVVKGDKKREASENFFVDLSDLSSFAVFLDSRGTGTIQNDD